MSDTSAGAFSATMTIVNMALMKYVPGLAIAVKIPFVGGFISGIGAGISNHLRDMFGAYPDPPDPPEGYHYGTYPIVTSTYVSNPDYVGYSDPEADPSDIYSPHIWAESVVVNGNDILLTDETNIPVADYNKKKGTFKEITGFTLDGVAIRTDINMKYAGKLSTGVQSRFIEDRTPNLWLINDSDEYAVKSASSRADMLEKAEIVAEQINTVPNVWPVALAIILLVSLIIWKVKK